MKMLLFCITIILMATFISLANSEGVSSLELQGVSNNTLNFFPNEKIFHQCKNKIRVDFKAVEDKLVTVEVAKNNEVILKDSVADLPKSAMYEINLKDYGKGEFRIALVTALQKKITETFIIR